MSEIQGWMNEKELEWLSEQAGKANIIVEIGCWKGRSTVALASNCKGIVFTVDNWRGNPDRRETTHKEVTTEEGRSKVLNEAKKNLKEWLGKSLFILEMNSHEGYKILKKTLKYSLADFIFIDGDHSYETVIEDIMNYSYLLKADGILSGHDISWPGVKKALDELYPDYKNGAGSIWWTQI